MFLRGLKSTQKSIHDTEAETEKEEEVRIKFFKPGRFWVIFGSRQFLVKNWVGIGLNFCVGEQSIAQ